MNNVEKTNDSFCNSNNKHDKIIDDECDETIDSNNKNNTEEGDGEVVVVPVFSNSSPKIIDKAMANVTSDNDADDPAVVTTMIDTTVQNPTTMDEFSLIKNDMDDINTNSNVLLRLPSIVEAIHCDSNDNSNNGDRTVPILCAICLSPYEIGDSVSWSPISSCQHAFHTDCIVEWLARKQYGGGNQTTSMSYDETSKCPLCRCEFCPSASSMLCDMDRQYQIHQLQQQQYQYNNPYHYPNDRNNNNNDQHLLHRDLNFVTSASILATFTQALAMSQFYRVQAPISDLDQQQQVQQPSTLPSGGDAVVSASSGTGRRRVPVASILHPHGVESSSPAGSANPMATATTATTSSAAATTVQVSPLPNQSASSVAQRRNRLFFPFNRHQRNNNNQNDDVANTNVNSYETGLSSSTQATTAAGLASAATTPSDLELSSISNNR